MTSEIPPETPASERPTEPAAPAAADRPSDHFGLELLNSRRVSEPRAWVWLALPLVGLLIVPLLGLVYTVAAPEPGEETASETGDSATSAKKKKKGKSAKKGRSDGAAKCCKKLASLGKTAPLDQRSAFLSAAQACESAPDETAALSLARSNLGTARTEIPSECE